MPRAFPGIMPVERGLQMIGHNIFCKKRVLDKTKKAGSVHETEQTLQQEIVRRFAMRIKMNWTVWILALALVAIGSTAIPAFAKSAGSDFVTVKSAHGYSATVDSLQQTIKNNGLMVMGRVNQKAILSMTGLEIEGGESFLVGNPRVGKKLFGMNRAVAAVIPARISVWADHGRTYVGYFKPSALMGMISHDLADPGAMLDKKFARIVQDATN
jgi:uncharacterized protein (DUF302 family)